MKSMILCLVLCVPASGFAAVIQVPGDYATLQDAFSNAGNGDTIRIASGTYSGAGWVDLHFHSKWVTIEGASASARPVFDGQGLTLAWTFQGSGVAGSIVRNIVFQDCVDEAVGSLHILQEANITVSGCDIIRGGVTGAGGVSEGGGIRIWGASPTIENCRLIDCFALQGGGINILHDSNTVIRGCTISGCSGAAIQIAANCHPLIERTIISGNSASSVSWSAGISVLEYSTATIRQCMIANNVNTDSDGGGLRIENSSAEMTNCFVTGNSTIAIGGGILCKDNSNLTLKFCTVSDNSAGTYGDGVASLSNASVTIHGSIVWEPSGSDLYSATGGTISATYCDLSTMVGGVGNFSAPPSFIGAGDYHLTETSPCIDVVTTACEALDYDGETRTNPCDAGADEYAEPISLTVSILMPSTDFRPGDSFSLAVSTQNDGSQLNGLQLLVALEVAGQYWFHPSWTSFDSQAVDIAPGYTEYSILPVFTWPSGAGSYSGANFYAGCTDSAFAVLIGNLAMEQFGWSE